MKLIGPDPRIKIKINIIIKNKTLENAKMKAFTKLTGIAAPMAIKNVDTDMIIPKQFLRTIKRTGLGKNLFDELRYNENGKEKKEFVLNQKPYRQAKILVAGENFGCGSSREHAPWALLDFGIRCIIAPSFADIFYNNSFKNGILPIAISAKEVDKITEIIKNTDNCNISIDLNAQEISYNEEKDKISFEIDPFRKNCLLKGLDDIALTLQSENDISKYETQIQENKPWLAPQTK